LDARLYTLCAFKKITNQSSLSIPHKHPQCM
jgi:hypothetical protein